MIPQGADAVTFWEHIYRYRFAAPLVRGKRVLDIACGAGYGSAALLKAGAKTVIGVDIAQEVCDFARRTFSVDARCGNAEAIPLDDGSVDAVVSFETIEHLARPETFLSECKRVLVRDGILIISTPNREVYSPAGKHNPFHTREFDELEFIELLEAQFRHLRLYTQTPRHVRWWSIRSLAALSTPWVDVRGFWRVRDTIRRNACLHLWEEVAENYRSSPVEQILSQETLLSSLVNPYLVRKSCPLSHEEPRYLLALARA